MSKRNSKFLKGKEVLFSVKWWLKIMFCLMSAVSLVGVKIWLVHLKAWNEDAKIGIRLISSSNTSRENHQNIFYKKSLDLLMCCELYMAIITKFCISQHENNSSECSTQLAHCSSSIWKRGIPDQHSELVAHWKSDRWAIVTQKLLGFRACYTSFWQMILNDEFTRYR